MTWLRRPVAFHSALARHRRGGPEVPRILLWDTGDPYYYVRLESPQGPATTS